jgi:hypothetical protein
MVRRSDFLEGLKARLDDARAEPEQPVAATAPRWPVAQTAVEDDPSRPAVGEPTAPGDDAPALGDEWHERATTTRQAPLPPGLDDRPPPSAEGIGAAAASEPDHPKPAKSWSERAMPEGMRAAIASVRRISTGARPDPDRHKPERFGSWAAPDHRVLQETFDQVARPGRTRQATGPERTTHATRRGPPGQAALWPSPEDEWPVPVPATRRRGIRVAALVATTVVVLLVGSSLGLLPAGWNLELPSLPTGTAASPPEPVAQSEAPPTASPAPPPITEIVRVERAPVPPAATAEHPPKATGAALAPPRPAPRSSGAGEGPSATDPIDQALETLLGEAGGSGGPFEPVIEEAGARPALRVSVHYAATTAGGPATAMHLVRHLKAQGFAVEAREVGFPIASDSIRYFFDADREAAEALSSSLAGQVPGGGAPPVVDFTHYEPKPQEGHLELWIGV